MNNPQVICIEQSREADGQTERKNGWTASTTEDDQHQLPTEQSGKASRKQAASNGSRSRAGQSNGRQDRATDRQPDQQEPETDLDLGEGVPELEAGGMNRARDSQRLGTVAKIASPPQFQTPTPQDKTKKPNRSAEKNHNLALWGYMIAPPFRHAIFFHLPGKTGTERSPPPCWPHRAIL